MTRPLKYSYFTPDVQGCKLLKRNGLPLRKRIFSVWLFKKRQLTISVPMVLDQ